MSGSLFRQLCGSLNGRVLLLMALGIGLLVIALFSGVITALAWDAPQTFVGDAQVLLLLDPQLSNEALNSIYLQIRDLPEVAQLQFALSVDDLDVPTSDTFDERSPAILIYLAVNVTAQDIIESSRTIGGVKQAIPLSTGSAVSIEQSQIVKPILLTVSVVCLLASFFSLNSGVQQLVRKWRGELELLRLSGVPRRNVILSFSLMGIFSGAIGSVVSALLIYASTTWASIMPQAVRPYLPNTQDMEFLIGWTLLAIIVGLFLGGLAGSWGTRARETI